MTLSEKFTLILNFFELSACLTGLIYYRKLRFTFWRYFVVFLILSFTAEMVAKFINYRIEDGLGNVIYRYVSAPVTFLSFLLLFYKWFAKSKYQRIALLGMLMFTLAWIAEEIFLKKSKYFFGFFSYQVAVVFLLALAMVYYKVIISYQSGIGYQTDLMFWVVTGILAYYVVTLPMYALRSQLFKAYPEGFLVYWKCSNLLNYVMYTFFIIGIKWGTPHSSYSAYSEVLPL